MFGVVSPRWGRPRWGICWQRGAPARASEFHLKLEVWRLLGTSVNPLEGSSGSASGTFSGTSGTHLVPIV